jgi:pSer/pThr/pTyr-binding forkhead associated (FHA) protein
MIALANDDLFVTDLNSTNGSYVDEARVARTTIVPVGSVLRLGEVSLRHVIRSGAGEVADPPRRFAAMR